MELKEKIISAEQYNNLPRAEKRVLQRVAKKNGRTLPDMIPTRTKLMTSVKTEILHDAIRIIENTGITLEEFLDFSFQQLITANQLHEENNSGTENSKTKEENQG